MAHVLIIDDDPAVSLTLVRMLEFDGHRVSSVEHARDGLSQIALDRPDAVLLDMRMPDMGGLEFLRELRRVPANATLPVAIITGDYFLKEDVMAELGTLDASICYKPVWMEDLTSLTRELLARALPPAGA